MLGRPERYVEELLLPNDPSIRAAGLTEAGFNLFQSYPSYEGQFTE